MCVDALYGSSLFFPEHPGFSSPLADDVCARTGARRPGGSEAILLLNYVGPLEYPPSMHCLALDLVEKRGRRRWPGLQLSAACRRSCLRLVCGRRPSALSGPSWRNGRGRDTCLLGVFLSAAPLAVVRVHASAGRNATSPIWLAGSRAPPKQTAIGMQWVCRARDVARGHTDDARPLRLRFRAGMPRYGARPASILLRRNAVYHWAACGSIPRPFGSGPNAESAAFFPPASLPKGSGQRPCRRPPGVLAPTRPSGRSPAKRRLEFVDKRCPIAALEPYDRLSVYAAALVIPPRRAVLSGELPPSRLRTSTELGSRLLGEARFVQPRVHD